MAEENLKTSKVKTDDLGDLGEVVVAHVEPPEVGQPRERLGERAQRVLPQLQDPQPGEPAEVGGEELEEGVVQVQLGDAEKLIGKGIITMMSSTKHVRVS